MYKDFKKLCNILSKPKYSEAIYNILFDDVGVNLNDAWIITKYIKQANLDQDLKEFACTDDANIKYDLAYIDEEIYNLDKEISDDIKRLEQEKCKARDIRNKVFEALHITNFAELTRKRIIDQVYTKFKKHIYKGSTWYLKIFDETEILDYKLASIKAEQDKDYLTLDFIFKYNNHYYIMFLRNKKYKRR